MKTLIIGCGYLGIPLGRELNERGHTVYGLRRSPAADQQMKKAGIIPLHADITEIGSLTSLPRPFQWVVFSASSTRGGLEDYRRVYLTGTRRILEQLQSDPPLKYVYTSSTGVYGQLDGSEVTEESETSPDSETGRILVETEREVLDLVRSCGFPGVILRLAGIYGPGRTYFLKKFLAGDIPLAAAGGRMMNMIHRDDAVGAIIAALERGRPGDIYNVCDDLPVSQNEFFHWLSQQLHRSMPGSEGTDSAPPRKRGITNKRVLNHRLKRDLKYAFRYPTFREGYRGEIERAVSSGART